MYNFTGTNLTAGGSSNTLGYVEQYAKVIKTAYDGEVDGNGIIESSVVVGDLDNNGLYYIEKDDNGNIVKKILIKVIDNTISEFVLDEDCTEINQYAFYECTELLDVYISLTEEEYKNKNIEKGNKNEPYTLAKYHYMYGWTLVNIVESTCTQEGYEEYVKGDRTLRLSLAKLPHEYGEDNKCKLCGVDGPPYSIKNEGDYYFAKSDDGTYISNNKGKNSTTAKSILTANGGCKIRITWSVSSESSYDKFSIVFSNSNYTNVQNKSGIIANQTIEIELNKGDTITFTYSKDSSAASGEDCAKFKIEIVQ